MKYIVYIIRHCLSYFKQISVSEFWGVQTEIFEKLERERVRYSGEELKFNVDVRYLKYFSECESYPSVSLCYLDEPILTGEGFIIWNNNFHSVVGRSFGEYNTQKIARKYTPLFHAKNKIIALNCIGCNDTNYYHFVYDTLFALLYLTKNTCGIPVLRDGVGYIKEFAQLIDKNLEPIYLNRFDAIKPTALYALTNHGYSGRVDPRKIRYISDWSKKIVVNQNGVNKFPKKIYISRINSKARRMLNEADLIDKLSNLGFEIVQLEELSVFKQMKLFSSSSIVIGPHGAGLSNVVFCNSNVEIYEIRNSKYINNCFEHVAINLGLKYKAIYGTPIESSDKKFNEHSDWVADVDHVVHELSAGVAGD